MSSLSIHEILQQIQYAGTSPQAIRLTDDHVRALIYIAAQDIGIEGLPAPKVDIPNFFDPNFDRHFQFPGDPIEILIQTSHNLNQETSPYIKCLAQLYKSRLMYREILETQPLPTMDQVGPRALLQFSQLPAEGLADLLVWRKWLYDVDNRAAQVTGYLFEPIISAAIGGAPKSASKSPIRRSADSSKGRQIDCLKGRTAYEIKMRITIAASGQGRWGEELSFPADAKNCNFTPVLLVFDSTPNEKLDEICQAYKANGGKYYLGKDAWDHLKASTTRELSIFLEKYVHTPLESVVGSRLQNSPLEDIVLQQIGNKILFSVGNDTLPIPRRN